MNLQCQRHEYASGIAFCPLFGANNGILPWQMQSAQNFQFPQRSNLLFGSSTCPFIFKSPLQRKMEAEKSTPQLQVCFLCLSVCVCVYVCVCACARALYYVLLLFWYKQPYWKLSRTLIGGAVIAKDKYVNNYIGRYF